jgi:cytochrome c oxidase assembly protein Cox11
LSPVFYSRQENSKTSNSISINLLDKTYLDLVKNSQFKLQDDTGWQISNTFDMHPVRTVIVDNKGGKFEIFFTAKNKDDENILENILESFSFAK